MLYWLLPSLRKQKSNRLLLKEGGGYFGVSGRNWLGGRLEAFQQHCQPLADPPSPDSTNPKISAFSNVTFTSLRSSTVRTLARPQNQQSTAQKKHKGLCTILQGASTRDWLSRDWLPRDWLPGNYYTTFCQLAKLFHTRRALSSTITNPCQEPFWDQACNTPTNPLCFFLSLCGGGILRYPVPKWLLFLNYCGECFSSWQGNACIFFRVFQQRQLPLVARVKQA